MSTGETPAPLGGGGRSDLLKAARGGLAVLVMCYHASASIFAADKYWGTTVFGGVFDAPYGRIEFFFVASGLVIALRHWGELGEPARLRDFAGRRARSIYPLYWIVLAGVLALGLLPWGYAPGTYPPPQQILASVLLLGADSTPTVLAVAWTLYHEMLFYLVMGVAIWSRRAGLLVAMLWLALIAARAAGYSVPGVPPYVSDPINLLFAFGVAAALWLRRGGAVPVAACAAVALLLGGGLLALWGDLAALPEAGHRLGFGLAWALALVAMLGLERRRRVRVPGVLLRLGEASYALYLIHFAALSVLAKLAIRSGFAAAVPPEVAFVTLLAIILASALLFHRWIEVPLQARLRGRAGTPPLAVAG